MQEHSITREKCISIKYHSTVLRNAEIMTGVITRIKDVISN